MSDSTWIRTFGNKSFYHNTGTMRTDGTFQVGGNGSRLLVKTDGKVGVGVTNPTEKLHVNGNILSNDGLYSNRDGEKVLINQGGNNPRIELRDSDSDGGNPYIDFSNDNSVDYDARIALRGNDVLSIDGTKVGI